MLFIDNIKALLDFSTGVLSFFASSNSNKVALS
jgi:hypothetical protein